MCIGQAGEERVRGQEERGDRDFSTVPKVRRYVLSMVTSPGGLTGLGSVGWRRILGYWPTEQMNEFNLLMRREKVLRLFRWPKFVKVFWAFPNLLSVSFKQMRWNSRGSKDWTEELSCRPKPSKQGFLPEYLKRINENVSSCHPLPSSWKSSPSTASGEPGMYLFQEDTRGLHMVSYGQRRQ